MKKHTENLSSRVVLVTGGSGGIGRAVVSAFARAGERVAFQYCSQDSLSKELAEQLTMEGLKVQAFQADLTDSRQVDRLFNEIESAFGPVEVLVNAAGSSEQNLFQFIDDASWRKMMAVNVDASFYCCRRAVSNMIENRNGFIVNLSSIWGTTGASMEVHYSTAKSAVIGMTKALAKELGPSNIKVNCVAPGWIDTDMNLEHDHETMAEFLQDTPLGRIGKPQEVADLIAFLCSERASFMTGQVISPNGGVVI